MQETATAVQAASPLGGMARSLYEAHSLAGNGGLDFSSALGPGVAGKGTLQEYAASPT